MKNGNLNRRSKIGLAAGVLACILAFLACIASIELGWINPWAEVSEHGYGDAAYVRATCPAVAPMVELAMTDHRITNLEGHRIGVAYWRTRRMQRNEQILRANGDPKKLEAPICGSQMFDGRDMPNDLVYFEERHS